MPLPNQNIPESAKTLHWMRQCVASIARMSYASTPEKVKDKFCYDMYSGAQNEGDFDYLRKVDDYEYPAKIRFVPLLRPKFDRLRAEETKRAFNYRVFTIDSNSIEDKNQKRFQKIVEKMAANKKKINQQYKAALQNLDDLNVQFQAARRKAQEEVGQVPPELEQAIRQAEREIEMGRYVISHENLICEEELEEIEVYFKYKFKDFLEVIAEKGIKFLMATQSLRDEFNLGFEDKMVTDKEYYFCDWEEDTNREDPEIRKVSPLGFYYAADSQVNWVGESEWCMEERWMTLNQIIDEFGDKLDAMDLDKLKNRSSYINSYGVYEYGYYGQSYGMGPSGNVDNCGIGGNIYGSEEYANLFRVCRCYWQSPCKVRTKKSPNPHRKEEAYFTNFMGEDDKIRPDKGEKEQVGYKNDVYQGILIDGAFFVDCRKKVVPRSNDNFGRVELPYIGRAHNYYTRRPYSLVWAAKDVQILYNIIHYHKELWLALSGVKGFIMDKSQVPEGMSIKEWMYQRKLGVGWIQSVRTGLGKQPSFNQFQNFDDSMGPGIQYILMMLEHLENLASSIIGVSPQRMGDVAPTDQVGTTKESIANSSLVTEILFYDHDETKRRVLTRAINLCRMAWKKGKRGSYILGDFAQELLDVPANVLERADYMVFNSDTSKEQRAIDDLKAMSIRQHEKGQLTFSNLVKLYNIDNLRELEAKVQQYEELAMKRATGNLEAERAHERELKKMDADLKLMLDKQADDAKNTMANIEQAKLQWEREKFVMEQQAKKYDVDSKSGLGHRKIATEEKVELAFLDQQKREANADIQLKRADLAAKGVDATQANIVAAVQKKEKVKD